MGAEAHMVKAIRGARLSGGRLLDDPLDDLLQLLGYGNLLLFKNKLIS